MSEGWKNVEAVDRQGDGLTRWLIGLLVLVLILQPIQIYLGATTFRLDGSATTAESMRVVLLSLPFTLIGWAQVIVALIWMYRASRNVTDFGMVDRRWGPGWAVGAWFIPFANLVLPYFPLRRIWWGSQPSTTFGAGEQPRGSGILLPMFVLWSAMQLMALVNGAFMGVRNFMATLSGEPAPAPSIWFIIVTGVMYLAAGILYLVFVRTVAAWQAQRMHN